MIFRFVCLSVFVTGACAIVCTPEICMTVRCAAVTADNCNGVIKENGGFCGCCDACITELGRLKQIALWLFVNNYTSSFYCNYRVISPFSSNGLSDVDTLSLNISF